MNFEDFYGACFAFGGGELLQKVYLMLQGLYLKIHFVWYLLLVL